MSQVTLYFAVAPAVAPLLGGWGFAVLGWHAVFWMLAVLGALLGVVIWRRLPETLHDSQRQPFHPMDLLRGYAGLVRSPKFLALVVASGVPFNGMFLYVLSAPAFVGDHLGLAPTQFFWFFAITVSGIMGGAWLSGRLAGRVPWRRQIRWGFVIMSTVSVLNVLLNFVFEPNPWWSMWPIGLYALGWSLMTPVVTLLVLDRVPEGRGMASSVHASISSAANALVAGALTPLVMNSPRDLALAALGMMAAGLVSWTWVKRQVT